MTAAFSIGAWQIQPRLNRVVGPAGTHTLEPRTMRLLVSLAEQRGDVVTREELLDAVWEDTIVTEHSLTNAISDLRKLFDDDPRQPRVIETIRGVGYRLIAPIHTAPPVAPPPAPSGDGVPTFSVSMPATPAPTTTPARRWLPWTLAGTVLFILGAVLLSSTLTPTASLLSPSLRPVTTLPGIEISPTFSPDGERLAFVAFDEEGVPSNLFVQQIHAETPVALTQQQGAELFPAWSPDGESLAYFSYGQQACGLYHIPSQGGASRKLIDTSCRVTGLAWSPDGQQVVFAAPDSALRVQRLFALNLADYSTRPLTTPAATEAGDTMPVFSRDGAQLLFMRHTNGGLGMAHVLDLTTPATPPRPLLPEQARINGFAWTPDGDVLLSGCRTEACGIWRLSPDGQTAPALLRSAPVADPGSLTLSPDGTRMAFVSWAYEINVWQTPIGSTQAASPEATRLIASTRADRHPRVSPNGRQIAFVSNRTGTDAVWISDRDGANPLRLTTINATRINSPRWSPDGRWLLFEVHQGQDADLYRIDAAGGPPQRLTDSPAHEVAPRWSPDGTAIYFASDRTGTWQLWKQPLGGGPAEQVTQQGARKGQRATDGTLFFTRPHAAGLWRKTPGGTEEAWLPEADAAYWDLTDDALYYVTQERLLDSLHVHRFDFATGTTDLVTKLPINPSQPFDRWGFSVTPDEQHIIYSPVDHAASDVMLMENAAF